MSRADYAKLADLVMVKIETLQAEGVLPEDGAAAADFALKAVLRDAVALRAGAAAVAAVGIVAADVRVVAGVGVLGSLLSSPPVL